MSIITNPETNQQTEWEYLTEDGSTLQENPEPTWHSDYPLFWRIWGRVWLWVRCKIWNHGGSNLYWRRGKRPPIQKWWIRWADPGWNPCEACGYKWEWGDSDGWFKCEDAGTSYCPGEPDIHWFEGTQTCPRCRTEFYYSDSD